MLSYRILCSKCLPLQGAADGDCIIVYPSKIDPHCEALVFVLSASDSDVSTMNLTTPDTLQFNGHSAGQKIIELVVSQGLSSRISCCMIPGIKPVLSQEHV